MNTRTNLIWAFLGGVAVGAFGAIGVMKKLGYSKPIAEDKPFTEK